jgi:beta-lactamase regulating signal transducer with metallopeptidase domain
VTVGGVLLVYAVTVGFLLLPWYRRARWPLQSPRLAIAVYLAAAWSVLAALTLAGLTLAVPATALGGGISDVLGACVLRLRAEYATPGGAAVAAVGIAVSAALLLRIAIASATQVATMRSQARRQVELARLVGKAEPGLGALVVESDQPSAFCVGGAQPMVVFTSAALDTLDRRQLGAVLAHERAHLAHRHHWVQTAAKVIARALPIVPLLREAPDALGRLIEMHADDVATVDHDRSVLATALVALATPSARQPALAAGATDVLARMRRLLAPAPPLARAGRGAASAAAALLVLLPLFMAGTPALIALALGRVSPQ